MSVTKSHVSLKPVEARRKAVLHRAIEQLEDRRMMSATLALTNPDTLPANNRLIFNYVQNPDTTVPNVVHNTQTLIISDTGTTPLVISSMAINGPWAFVNAPAGGYTNTTVTPGAPLTVTLAFTQRSLPAHSYNETNYTSQPNGGAAITGSLTINSNDSVSPSKVVTLAGYWQNLSNSNEEPSLQTVVNLVAGYQTSINATPIPDLTEANGVPQYYGSETVSNSWEPANPSQQVSLQEIGSFRTEGNNAAVYWYTAAAQQSHLLFTDASNQGQTLLPTLANGALAEFSFTPTGAFGLRVDNEYSTDSINVAAGNTGGGGHHFRFFPVVDATGNTVANTYIVTMDYGVIQTENFDFNDNTFIVSNIRPATTPETPAGLTATNGPAPTLTWTADSYSPVAYNVYSSTTLNGTYTKLTATPITTTSYTDSSNTGTPVYYHVTGIDTTQTPAAESFPATASSNVGPITSPESFSTYKGVPFTFNPLLGVSDATGTLSPAGIQVSTPNHGGTAVLNSVNGLVTYTPAANYVGTETFNFTVTDSNNVTSAPTTVTVVVSTPLPVAPVANNLVVTDLANVPTQINVLSVDNATTAFNVSSITITTQPTDGTVALNGDGTVTYTPGSNFVGGDEFRYTVVDNNTAVSNVGIVDINVGTEISSAKGAIHVLNYNDENGTPVTVTLNKGVADVFFDGTGSIISSVKGKTKVSGTGLFAREVTLSGTTAASVFRMAGLRGAQFNLAGINDAGELGAVVAPGADLRSTGSTSLLPSSVMTGTLDVGSAAVVATATPSAGTINLAGVRSISLRNAVDGNFILGGAGVANTSLSFVGSVTDTKLSSSVALGTIRATKWIKSAIDIQPVSAPSIANLSIAGEFDPDLTLNSTGRLPALGTAHIGTAAIGNWTITGNARVVSIGIAASSWGGIEVSGLLSSMTVAHSGLNADVTAGTINGLRIAGTLASNVTTTGNLNSLATGLLIGSVIDVGATAANITTASLTDLGTAKLGSLRVTSRAANAFSNSSIIADMIGSVVTGQINTSGTTEGIAAAVLKNVTLGLPGHGNVHVPNADLVSDAALESYLSSKSLSLGTLAIEIL